MDEINISESSYIAEKIQSFAKKAQSETEIQFEIERLIKNYFEDHDTKYEPRQNVTVIKGRPDTLYGRVIIEYKIPGSLSKPTKLAYAITEAHDNIIEVSQKVHEDRAKFLGIIIDGLHITFTKFRNNIWINDPLVEINTESIKRMLECLRGLSRKPLEPISIIEEFGPESNLAKNCIITLYNNFRISDNERVNILYLDWKRIFNQVCGYEFISPKLSVKTLMDTYGFAKGDTDIAKMLFSIHTYYALFIKMLSAEITATFASTNYNSFLDELIKSNPAKFKEKITSLEDGGIFSELGIKNFLEGDYFAWYTDVWNNEIHGVIDKIARKLLEYEPATTSLEPDIATDLLRHLYEKLLPKKIRHDLGEYFTPGWLVDTLLDEINYHGDYTKRVLDPTCGSGSFIVHVLKKILNQSNEIKKGVLLNMILKNVVGFDLNPLAVIAARANYLITISDLLRYRTDDIYIPIYLCDAISVKQVETLSGAHYEVITGVGAFRLPTKIMETKFMDTIFSLLDECVKTNYTPEEFILRLKNEVQNLDIDTINSLKEVYSKLFKLEQLKIDRIWARVIKNSLAPIFVGKFDFIVGNPPWVNWEYLPNNYRESITKVWENYKLTEGSNSAAFKRDISMTFVAVGISRYLEKNGKLGLLIPFTLFKNQAGSGFRKFLANHGGVFAVHDMVRLKPFEGAVTRTSMILCSSGQTNFPILSTVWDVNEKSSLDSHTDVKDMLYNTTRKKLAVNPIEGKSKPESSWLFLQTQAVDAVKRVLGCSEYKAQEGCNTRGANGIFWVTVLEKIANNLRIKNFSEGGRITIENIVTTVDDEHVYPLLRGRDIDRWKSNPQMNIIIPHASDTGKLLSEEILKTKYPKTFNYFSRFLRLLEERKFYGNKIRGKFPFYTMFQINSDVFSPYKVVWSEISGEISGAGDFHADFIGPSDNKFTKGKPVIPDHKVMFVPFHTEDEACYLTGVLNSSPIRLIISGYTIETSISTHILKHVWIPKFNPKDSNHKEIIKTVKNLKSVSDEKITPMEYKLDELVAKLYDITSTQMQAIQKSLK
jgi:hypothetical protein